MIPERKYLFAAVNGLACESLVLKTESFQALYFYHLKSSSFVVLKFSLPGLFSTRFLSFRASCCLVLRNSYATFKESLINPSMQETVLSN